MCAQGADAIQPTCTQEQAKGDGERKLADGCFWVHTTMLKGYTSQGMLSSKVPAGLQGCSNVVD